MKKPPDRPPVQVFGRDDSQATRAALRFFKERKVGVTYANLKTRPMAPGELRRFVERLGATACADTDGRPWRDAGLGPITENRLTNPLPKVARVGTHTNKRRRMGSG